MDTTTAVLSVRKLLAFACLQLSLVVLGVALVVDEVAYEGGDVLLFAGLASLVVSAVWLFRTVTTPNPAASDDANPELPEDETGDSPEGGSDATPRGPF